MFKLHHTIELLEGEAFWGGAVGYSAQLPLSKESSVSYDTRTAIICNPICGNFVSTAGRCIFVEGEYRLTARDGKLTFSCNSVPELVDAGSTLKEAYLYAASRFSPDPIPIPSDLLTKPQYCTWMEYGKALRGEDVLAYARGILDRGLSAGLLIFDEGWARCYGDFTFDGGKFPDPAGTVETLHSLGFKVSLWLTPFIDPAAPDFDLLRQSGALVLDRTGKVAMRKWWEGRSAVLDLTSPFARSWLHGKLRFLMREYGVDGFKFDAGDPLYYRENDLTTVPVSPCGQSERWTEFAAQYEIGELRACYGRGGTHTVIRLCDKRRSWTENNGLASLVPNMIQAGMCGYPFVCPDMVGGGRSADLNRPIDRELIIRYAECSALMPCIQFSGAFREEEGIGDSLVRCEKLHLGIRDTLLRLIEIASKTHEPILRPLEYEFPHQGYGRTADAYLLGEDLLVKPVVKKGQKVTRLRLPSGASWKYVPTGEVYEGGKEVAVPSPVGTLPHFVKLP